MIGARAILRTQSRLSFPIPKYRVGLDRPMRLQVLTTTLRGEKRSAQRQASTATLVQTNRRDLPRRSDRRIRGESP